MSDKNVGSLIIGKEQGGDPKLIKLILLSSSLPIYSISLILNFNVQQH